MSDEEQDLVGVVLVPKTGWLRMDTMRVQSLASSLALPQFEDGFESYIAPGDTDVYFVLTFLPRLGPTLFLQWHEDRSKRHRFPREVSEEALLNARACAVPAEPARPSDAVLN